MTAIVEPLTEVDSTTDSFPLPANAVGTPGDAEDVVCLCR